jgi:SAM-dependent methyltransferase
VQLGDLGGVEPVSRDCARERGTPVDAYFEARFFEKHAADLHGSVLRLDTSDPAWEGGVEPGADWARVLGSDAGSRDAVVCRGVLESAADPVAAVRTLRQLLRPGGVLLVALCGMGVCSRRDEALWRFTPASAARLFDEGFEPVRVASFGNVRAAAACVQGIAAEEIGNENLAITDPDYPVVVGVRAVRTRDSNPRIPDSGGDIGG